MRKHLTGFQGALEASLSQFDPALTRLAQNKPTQQREAIIEGIFQKNDELYSRLAANNSGQGDGSRSSAGWVAEEVARRSMELQAQRQQAMQEFIQEHDFDCNTHIFYIYRYCAEADCGDCDEVWCIMPNGHSVTLAEAKRKYPCMGYKLMFKNGL